MHVFPFRRPRGAVLFLATAALFAAIVGSMAPAGRQASADEETARLVVGILKRYHLAHPAIDDVVSKKWFANFLKALDPQKYYFEKGDIEGFSTKAATLDDSIENGDITFAKQVFEVFKKRSDERFTEVMKLLAEKPDFTVDESLIDDPEHTEYPANAAEANERWRKRIKLDLLYLKVDGVDQAEAVKRLTVRYRDRNRGIHQFDTTDLLEIYLTSLATTLDAHTSYMGPKTVEDLKQALRLSLEGIGASLGSEDGYAVVKEIIAGGAADRDGRLQVEDKIVALQKDDGSEIDLVEKKLSDVVRQIRGPKGSKIRLVVQPHDTKERKIYELTRDKIQLLDQHAKSQIVTTKVEGREEPVKIGVIQLPSFYGSDEDEGNVSATTDCRHFLEGFIEQKVDAVLIDLRGNGGGLLGEAISLSGLFIKKGPVVQVRDYKGVQPPLNDRDDSVAYTGPLAVLIDHQSASASEIFAGVIRDYGRGLIIGDSSTYGKGTVQKIFELNDIAPRGMPDIGALKLTIQQFYRANGDSTQIKGVPPHVHIPSLLDQYDIGEGKSEAALKFDKIQPLEHDQFGRTPVGLVDELNARSAARRASNPKFQKQSELIKKVLARKEKKAVSLQEEKFRAEYVPPEDDEDGEAKKDEPKSKPKRRPSDRPAWEAGFYNDEVVSIIADYVTLGAKELAAKR